MAIEIYFEYEGTIFKLPVTPEEIKLQRSGNNEIVEVVGLGEINQLKKPKLSKIEIESFFPSSKDASYVLTKGKFKNADYYIKTFEKIMKAKKPLRLIVSDTRINLMVSIESFDYWIGPGDAKDVYFKLSMLEYREHKVKEVKLVETQGAQNNKKKKKTTKEPREQPSKKAPYVGCKVKVNGQLHRDSYGSGGGQWLKNFEGKINFINNSGTHPYHITDMSGAWFGWVLASAVEVIS